jgi:hypothetical protein
MRYVQRTERIGERVGDIDWGYDFRSHFNNMCSSDERRDQACAESVAQLRAIDAAWKEGRTVRVTSDGGWPRFGWGEVLDVGMYDGWPYWKPTPAVLKQGPLGAEWKFFVHLDAEFPAVEARQA